MRNHLRFGTLADLGVAFKGSSGGGTQQSTVKNETVLPQWVQDAGQQNYQMAQGVSQNLLKPYTGQRVADMTQGQQADIAALQQNVGSTNPAFASAQQTAAGLQGYQPGMVNPGFLSGMDLSSYMNPYTQNVIGSGLQGIEMQRQMAQNQNADMAIKNKAFGGSRFGIQEGVTNAGAARQAGDLASGLMNQNFMQAQSAAQGDLARNLQGQLANQQAGLSGANLNLNAANALGNLAQQGQTSFLQGASAGLAGQESVQQNQQAQLDAQRQLYTENQQYPVQQLQLMLQSLGMTPYGQNTSQTTTGPGPSSNGLLQGAGAASAGVGILGTLATTAAAFM